MYKEIHVFISKVGRQKSIWKDGEVWTAFILAALAGVWFYFDPAVPGKIRGQFGALLTLSSILLGFTLTAISVYISSSSTWADESHVQNIANKLVDWHVWTVLNILILIAYILILWALGGYCSDTNWFAAAQYSVLAFLLLYIGFQILNHSLTMWWVFHKRKQLRKE